MIGNPYKGRSFKGLIRYLHHGRTNDPKPHRVIWSEGRNIATTNDKVLPAIMIATAELSSGVKKPVYHLPISWPPEEKLPKQVQLQVADQLLADLGLSEHQTLIVAHDDGDCPHIHIVVNTVHPETGRVWNAWRDVFRIMESLERQEKELGLRIVDRPDLEAHRSGQKKHDRKKGPTRDERKRAERMDDTPLVKWSETDMRERRNLITAHFKAANSWSDLEGRLQRHGLKLVEAGQGFRITDGTYFMQMSKVGKHAREDKLAQRYGESWEDYQILREDAEHSRQLEPPLWEGDSDDDYATAMLAEADALERQKQSREHTERLKAAVLACNDCDWYREKEREAFELGAKRIQLKRALRSHEFIGGRIVNDYNKATDNLKTYCEEIYQDPKAAMASIRKQLDAGKNMEDINLASAGKLRGWKFLGWASKARNEAHQAIARGGVQRSHERLRRLRNQQEGSDYERMKLNAQLGDLEVRHAELMAFFGPDSKRKAVRKELYRKRYHTLAGITEKEILVSELEDEQKERLIAVKSAMPSFYKQRVIGKLEPDHIWRSALPEDMKRRLAQHLEDRIERERIAEREGIAIDTGDWERDRQNERDAIARSMGRWGRGRGR
ncbi:relaxase/mobilization nuclease domain-containing protein [Paenochrobactrum pullorum]|uniref:relaxase/mobilization nuclease domain-containing protein n=1 Tax=Paenochrobactrum pullorum TaxID=1324351 RepID=UPI0035BC3AEF